jgi:cytochrome c oxidase subunit IV
MKTSVDAARSYLITWGALLVLLFLTWAAAQFNLGAFNVVAALFIAGAKMFLVIYFFMHVRHASKLTWLFVAGGFIWFLIMMDLTLSDYLARGLTGGWPKP